MSASDSVLINYQSARIIAGCGLTTRTDGGHCALSWLLRLVLAVLAGGGLPAVAAAGGGPENVLLVVNRNSPASLTIANHYAQLRQIPSSNVFTLAWDPKVQTTDVNTFREQILKPILAAIGRQRLSAQIDYVIYSSDFPWGIDLKPDVNKFLETEREGIPDAPAKPPHEPEWRKTLTPLGSINGLTYLWQPVVAVDPAYLQLASNHYMRRLLVDQKDAPTLGFKASRQFGPRGELLESDGRRYLLSMMLGVTVGRGNTLAEILHYLTRSAAADGTKPRGTIYYVQNNDIRSTTRQHGFPAAVEELHKLGVAAEILEGTVPVDKHDVQGAMLGTASVDWKASRSTILPGAICEHFTSFGGVMRAGAGQTPLSEFLRYGAAGSSGTVIEPYAIAAKFPTAMLHVHYARGCCLAEAFYQSVFGPYQLLIVGDPLCRPWADIPQVEVRGVEAEARVKGKLTLQPSAAFRNGGKARRFEVFGDGLLIGQCDPGGSFELDTTQLSDGYHELRVVAVEAGLIESQGRQIIPIVSNNHGRKITVSVEPKGSVRADRPLAISAESPGSIGIVVLHFGRTLGRINGQGGTLKIDAAELGCGPVQLRAIGLGTGVPSTFAYAPPIELTVEAAPPKDRVARSLNDN